MKVIVAGSRGFMNSAIVNSVLDHILGGEQIEIVCGMAQGADYLGSKYGKHYGLPIKEFPADWDNYGKGAGPMRNKKMAKYADVLIAFDTSGKGTQNMISEMEKLGKPVRMIQCQRFLINYPSALPNNGEIEEEKMKGNKTGLRASCGTEIKVGDTVDCYYRESDGIVSQQLVGVVLDRNENGRHTVDGNELALTCAPTVDLIKDFK